MDMDTDSDDVSLAPLLPHRGQLQASASLATITSESSIASSMWEAAGDSGPAQALRRIWERASANEKKTQALAVSGGRPRETTVRILVEEARQLLLVERPHSKTSSSRPQSSMRAKENEKDQVRANEAAAREQVEHVRASSLLQTVVCHVACGQQHAHTRPSKTTTGAVRWMHSVCFYFKEHFNDVLEKSLVFSVSCCITPLLSYLRSLNTRTLELPVDSFLVVSTL